MDIGASEVDLFCIEVIDVHLPSTRVILTFKYNLIFCCERYHFDNL